MSPPRDPGPGQTPGPPAPAEDRLVSPLAGADERVIEGTLRPKRLNDFIGQARVREQLSLVLAGALRRGSPPDHVLLSGPPGLGKTTIAMIIAAELAAPLRITSGPAIERAGDLAAVLSTLGQGEVVFIDEIHRVARPAEEMLYLAMEDFRVDVVVGKGPGATAIPLDIAPFTLVGATTRAGLLPAPLRDRFGFTAHLDFYAPAELEIILRRSASLLGVSLRDDGAEEIAGRSRGTPRIANRLLRRVRDYAEIRADGVVNRDTARAALDAYGRIDVLHNNVGIGAGDAELVGLSEDAWDRILDTNLKGMFLSCRQVLPVMRQQQEGCIINISSIAAVCSATSLTAYKISKAGVNAMTQSLAIGNAKYGVRVNAIMPGLINTPMAIEGLVKARNIAKEDLIRERDAQVPLRGKMGTAWDVAHAALFLASDEARFITGVVLPVDGGQSARIGG